jgi:hypothetical protein
MASSRVNRRGALAPHLLIMVVVALFVVIVFLPFWLAGLIVWVAVLGASWGVETLLRLTTRRMPTATPFLSQWLGWYVEPWYWGSKRNAARRAARAEARAASAEA